MMAENNKSLTLDDFRSEKYSELPLMDYRNCIFIFPFLETECPNMKDLCKYVLPLYAAHWKKIGVFLDIQPRVLERIEHKHPVNVDGCCMDLFINWLQGTDNVTWEKMFEAIDQATISFSIDSVTTTVTTSKLYVTV